MYIWKSTKGCYCRFEIFSQNCMLIGKHLVYIYINQYMCFGILKKKNIGVKVGRINDTTISDIGEFMLILKGSVSYINETMVAFLNDQYDFFNLWFLRCFSDEKTICCKPC